MLMRVESVLSLPDRPSDALSAFQMEAIEFFVHAAQALSLPKSVGEIYGLLFACEEPLALDHIVERLGISKGSVSQGLRFLQTIMAVERIAVPGDRRDHFVAELRLRRLVNGFLRERAEPHLASGVERLRRLEASLADGGPEETFVRDRVRRLQSWHAQASRLIPVVRRLVALS